MNFMPSIIKDMAEFKELLREVLEELQAIRILLEEREPIIWNGIPPAVGDAITWTGWEDDD